MQTIQETLINPLADAGWIPVDTSRFLYEMPYLDVGDATPPAVSESPTDGEGGSGAGTEDDMRYEMIMSFVHNNEIIGF